MKILITHQKGGVGKTTVSVALAKYFKREEDISVAIVDNDPQGSVIQFKDMYLEQGITIYHDFGINQINELKEDVVIIDTPPYLLENISRLAKVVNLIIIPIKASVLDLLAVKRTIDIISNSEMKAKTGILFNMIHKRLSLNAEIREQLDDYDIKVFDNYLTETVQFKNLILDDFSSRSKNQVEKLVNEIFEFLK